MSDKLALISSTQSYLTMKELAHSGARTKAVPEIYKGILVFPFDDYADGADHLLVYCAEKIEATASADSTDIAAVNFAQNDDLFWDAGASKLTNVASTNTPVGRVLEANDLSGGVVAGDTLIFELNPDLRTVDRAVNGVSAGYKVARGEAALDGGNPTSIAHGLTSCIAFTATLKGTAAPGVGTSQLTANINGANVDVYAWKPTSNADPTLIASTGTESFYWIAVGT